MYQKLILCGNVGQEPELRHTPSGKAVCTVSVATNRRWKDKASGEYKTQTTWFRVVAWEKQAELCAEYLSKGQLVLVEGEMVESKPFQTKSGEWRCSLEVSPHNIQWGKSVRERDADSDNGYDDNDDDEEIPF